MRKPTEITDEYRRIQQEGQDLKAEIKAIEARLTAAKLRHDAIYGGFAGYGRVDGILGNLRRELESARLYEADELLPKVRFGDKWKWEECVVRKVTAKQIRIADRGKDRELICSRETGKTTWGSAIHPEDLARILGGGQ